jgi:hypothetical protein
MEAEGVSCRQCLFTPLVTLWTFLGQVMASGADRSCRAAVARLTAWLAAQGAQEGKGPQKAPSAPGVNVGQSESWESGDIDTGPYCKARERLPERLVSRLARQAGADLHARYPSGLLLGGRKVKMVDGTTVTMPDTEQSQAAYPQSHTQEKGLGFPLMRLVVVMSLFGAAVLGMVCGPYKGKESGECSMFRTMLDDPGVLEEGDVVLADRYYASYWLLAMIRARKADAVMRQHQLRPVDFRKGERLGKDDHKVVLKKPERPKWMSQEQYEQMPEELEVREVRVRVAVKGFRVRTLVVVTTLLDAQLYPKEEIARAFRCRWHIELDLRSIKQTMGMSVLRCKTPQMARKEVWMHLLAYNLIRGVMAEAAEGVEGADVDPREVSFAGALQTLNAFDPILRMADPEDLPRLWEILLRAIGRQRVGNRPDRYEPRAVKRRAKPIAHLTVPRQQARRRLEREGPTRLAQQSQQQSVAN